MDLQARFGAFLSMHPPEQQFALARRCEALGLDSLWTGDHVSFHNPIYESLTLLASYASITSRIKLGSGVYLLALRRPTVVAKITSTLDALCGGRLIFGVGVGGENPKEFEACGVPHKERGARVTEGIDVVRALWRDTPSGPARRSGSEAAPTRRWPGPAARATGGSRMSSSPSATPRAWTRSGGPRRRRGGASTASWPGI